MSAADSIVGMVARSKQGEKRRTRASAKRPSTTVHDSHVVVRRVWGLSGAVPGLQDADSCRSKGPGEKAWGAPVRRASQHPRRPRTTRALEMERRAVPAAVAARLSTGPAPPTGRCAADDGVGGVSRRLARRRGVNETARGTTRRRQRKENATTILSAGDNYVGKLPAVYPSTLGWGQDESPPRGSRTARWTPTSACAADIYVGTGRCFSWFAWRPGGGAVGRLGGACVLSGVVLRVWARARCQAIRGRWRKPGAGRLMNEAPLVRTAMQLIARLA